MGLNVIPKFYQTKFMERIIPTQRLKIAFFNVFKELLSTEIVQA